MQDDFVNGLLDDQLDPTDPFFGSPPITVAHSLGGLANVYIAQGDYTRAEPLLERALAIYRMPSPMAFSDDDTHLVGSAMQNLAKLYRLQGRFEEAEPLFKGALAANERYLEKNKRDLATVAMEREHAEYERGLEAYERELKANESGIASQSPGAAALRELVANERKFAANKREFAKKLDKDSRASFEKLIKYDQLAISGVLTDLADLYIAQGRYSEAKGLLERSKKIVARNAGTDTPKFAELLNTLAAIHAGQGRLDEAGQLYERTLSMRERFVGRTHPEVAKILDNLSSVHRRQDRYREALDYARRATAIHRTRASRLGGRRTRVWLGEQKKARKIFINHVHTAWKASKRQPAKSGALTAETFEATQLAQVTSAAVAITNMGVRFATGDDALGRVVRARQDAVEERRQTDRVLMGMLSRRPDQRNRSAETRLRREIEALDRKLSDLDGRLSRDFPEYAELASPRPIPLEEIQKLLAPREALLTYVVDDDKTFLWVVRKDRADMFRLDIGQKALDEAVRSLRTGLDLGLSDSPAFDTTQAFQLYRQVFASAEPLLDGIGHVFVMPDGPLQSLPLGVLVTEKPQEKITDFSGNQQVPWLARKYALTTLPSVSSLKALRRFAKVAQASKPFGGFGDPLLEGHPGKMRGIPIKKFYKPQGGANVELVRSVLPPLPETADELNAMARSLGAGKDSLFLRERATETAVKTTDLSDTRVLAFATHALVAGELAGMAEPALVLTPPKKGTEKDDGLLTASEVATLKLDAHLVILSACNTAASDGTPNADALSGLAKAFFYAGSRALLVSHWPVESDATVRLTTGMLSEMASHPGLGRAEALRRSMLALMADKKTPQFAHPAYWAPFVVVGEGSAGASR